MRHLLFTCEEIDKLTLIKEYISERIKLIKKPSNVFLNEMPLNVRKDKSDLFMAKRKEFEARAKKYQHQIFQVVAAESWEEELEKWLIRICSQDINDQHYYFDISAQKTHIHNLIALQTPSGDPISRMTSAIFFAQGYEDGMEIIKELHHEEKDSTVKQKLGKMLKSYGKLAPHLGALKKIVVSKTGANSLLDWIEAQNIGNDLAYDIFNEFNHAVDYIEETKNNYEIGDSIHDVLEHLYESKNKNGA